MRKYVRRHISMCVDCLLHKKPEEKQPGHLHPISPGRRPFSVIHLDHIGPFETSTKRNRYILVLVDNLTIMSNCFHVERPKLLMSYVTWKNV